MPMKMLSDIPTLFAREAARNPNQTALLSGEERWSYGELDERSNQIARELRNQGIAHESIVAVLMDRSCDMIATLLGILKAGGAYAPLDPNDPAARLRDLLAALNPAALCCDVKFAGIAARCPIVTMDAVSVDANSANLEKVAQPESLAYVMFTSGSTGTPKAVLVEHRSIVRLFRESDLLPPDSGHVFLQLAPLAFDASTFEIWGALLSGSALAIMPAGLPSLTEIARAIRQYSVTTLWLTSGLFNAMVEQQMKTLALVKHVYTGGDVLSPVHVRKLLDASEEGTTLTNGYGPTENTVFTCAYVIPKDHPSDVAVPIGKPVAHTIVYVLDAEGQRVPTGEMGELYTGGDGVGRGYLDKPELTAEKFLDDPFAGTSGARMYRTGDLARMRPDGVVEFLGRADQQVKLRGFRIELGEIETALLQHPAVRQAAVVVRQAPNGEKYLAAYWVSAYAFTNTELDTAALRGYLGQKLPSYMVPAQFVALRNLPLNASGKIDRRALPAVEYEAPGRQVPQSELESIIANVWGAALGISSPEPDQAFFELGGNSLQLMRVHSELELKLKRSIAIADLFRCPTIRSLATFLGGESTHAKPAQPIEKSTSGSVAIIGLSGRFPGAKTVSQFWENLKNGVESISHFSDAELEAGAGPNAIKARSILEDVDLFDAAFFGITPKEAERIDPQHRVFLECSQEALDDAGYDSSRYPGAVGVFAGCSPNSYFLRHLCVDRQFIDDYTVGYQVANYPTMLGTSPDYLSSRVSYKLNLTGPSITMGTACSTSLVAVAQACENLLSGQCDMALAGGVSITLPQKRAYEYTEGGLASADGHCRPFDAAAQGTVFGSGCAVVLLKRLEDAVAGGDSIYAVIKGYGINNDGASKAGFTAPSVEGQAKSIRKAHQVAGIDPSTITYIEAHGTATPLGDPIEIAALTDAFRDHTDAKQFCAIGTAKANVGHLDAASGVTGLIKTALSLKHGILPPMLHYQSPNPRIDFENSPFYVNRELKAWTTEAGIPLRAGVSAFGIGGTNAHIVLEQAPVPVQTDAQFSHHVLLLSAKTPSALTASGTELSAHLSDATMADAAYTLQTGRRAFEYRRTVVCASASEAAQKLSQPFTPASTKGALPVVFAFPGQGAQYPGMGRQLYQSLPAFREAFDACSSALGFDLRAIIESSQLDRTEFAQPAIFATEYSLAKQWMAWGIQPAALIGHSVGEFVAACLAGVFSLTDGLQLVAGRGRMMQALPGGLMLSVRATEEQLRSHLVADVSIAAVNSPALCVAAGPEHAIAVLENALSADGIPHKRLRTSHAFHSQMVDPILGTLAGRMREIPLNPPKLRYVSTVTGNWITAAEATSPDYFARHCRETVQFSAAVRCLQNEREWCVLETGPGQSLTTLVRQHGLSAVASLPNPDQPEMAGMMGAVGGLWVAGNEPDWSRFYQGQRRQRVSLPSYPFERKRFWIEPPAQHLSMQERNPSMSVVSLSVSTPARSNRLRHELTALLEDLSGLDLASSTGATFLEMGFDSLFLTQVSQAVESKYHVKVRFARLLDDLSTVEQLAAFLDASLPAEVPEPVAAPMPTAIAAPASSGIEQLIKEQLAAFAELTARQFAMMQNAVPAAPVVEGPKEEPIVSPPIPAAPAKFDSFGPYKPIQKTAESITPQQQSYIQSFIERYNRKTQESKRLTQKHRAHLADPRVAAGFRPHWKELVYPLSIERSAGSRLWDVDGNEYVDLLNGFGVTMFGHRPQFVHDAVARQLFEGFEIGPQTPYAGKVADLLCEMTGMERAAFTNTGSEAVMAALRVARTVTNRKKIVYFAGDYHGMFDEVLVKGVNRPGALRSRPIAPGIPEEMAANAIVLEYGTPESLEIIRAHAGELAAVLVEPVQSRHPNLVPVEFLKELRQITEQHEVALVFDEVVTGFRTHPGGAQALFNIRADMATYGKVLGGGLPVGVLAGSAKYMDALDGGMWQYGDASVPEAGVTFFAGTFVRHPLAMASTWAVLNHLKRSGPRLQDELSEKTGRLVRSLNELFTANSVPTHIENFRSIFYFSFPLDQRLASLLYYQVREKGVHIQEGFPCFLTTAHTEEDLDLVIGAFRDSIAEMQQGGLLPASAPAEQLAPVKLAAPLALPVPAAAPPPALTPVTAPASYIEAEVPLTEAQLEIRLSAQLGDEESCSYNEGFGIHLQGPLNQPVLNRSLQLVVNRHEALRATLSESGESIRILNHVDVPFRVIDITALGEDERGHRVAQLKEEDAKTAFDLVHGPLVRAQLVRLAAEEHLLLITAHHLVCDGWSINIVLDEFAKVYSAQCQSKAADLPKPMSFAAYATAFASQNVDLEVEDFWSAEFSTPVAPLELPVDRPRPALKSYHGATAVARISEANYRSIKRAGAQSNATLLGTLLTGFQALLARLTGQNDIVVGIPAAAQAALAGETLVGHCVNLLPIRVKAGAEMKASDLLAATRRKLIDAYEHQSYTYGTLVRKLAIPRNPSRLPLIEVQFNLERVGDKLDLAGLECKVEQSAKRFVNFDLFLNIVESAAGLTLYCDYNTGLFDEATILRWLQTYETLLLAFAADPAQLLSNLSLLGDGERHKLLFDWNTTSANYPKNKSFDQIFSEQVAITPLASAVRFGVETLTYSDLDRRSNQLAHYLKRKGIGAGTLAGISLEPSLDMLVAVLAVMKAGGAYVPLDPNYPQDRLDFVSNDAGLHLTLCASNWPQFDQEPDTPVAGSDPDRLAYVIYTSGSTGVPKGVEIPHRALVNFLWSMQRQPGITPQDKLLAVTTLSFDIAGLELLLPLTVGAEIVIATSEARRDGRALLQLIETCGITFMQATPTTWKLMLDAGWADSRNLKALCGGEELTRDLANQLAPRTASVWNMYGPTETTIWSTCEQVTAGDGPVSIGRPIANTLLYILDAQGRPAPLGLPGELYIGGDGLARGYHNRAELTAERFFLNPFLRNNSARLYRTGDLVRYLPDGRLIYMGRLDNQVKIRGHRIELGEIEAALLEQPAVQDAAVIVRQDPGAEKRLVAYFVATEPGDLRTALSQRLPEYMIPSLFVSIEVLPLTPNGKIDRKALASMPPPQAVVKDRYVAPSTELECTLAAIWQEVLRVPRVGVDDDLFELGADSIHLFLISSRAAQRGVVLAPKQLLQHRNVRSVCAAIEEQNVANRQAPVNTISRASREKFRIERPA